MTRTPTRSPIRTAVIGFGLSGRTFHSPFIAVNPEFSLDVIVTGNAERQADARALHPNARIMSSTNELFARCDDLDLVVIGSPPASHVELAHAALDAALAVVIDKPFAVTSTEGLQLVEKAEALGLALTVFQNRRWDGDFLTLRALIASGTLGEIRRFESRFEFWKPTQRASWKLKATPHGGGGLLYDLGPHLIDQAIVLFGPVDHVYAETFTRREGGVADDDSFVALRHASGVTSHLWLNGLATQRGARFRVLGSLAGYTTWGLDGQEAALKNGALPTGRGFGVAAENSWGVLGIDGAVAPHPTERGRYDLFYAGLADALLRGAAVPVDPRDALRVIEIIEQVHATRS
ncbi:Gfo/Idh/MocA family protein [Cryobacterium psychrophilum]|uniref:Oxidoreductase n=1 Tax=Cryobacterium psychrophilum TaxID=41988 RepID=A0A4Y8KNS1_9MICO|nr:Gfo/Idh/MocA family oxidoreductase [Cryobacterium psychrophilum]TDW29272.1 putative dehydrogenase [Cryobacterium psychrophilum]TFD79952.1 oxidoreductase [Cryobacterium psychrophilum]